MADYTRFKLRGDVKADWLNANPVLALNEPALETDTKRFKIGDGVSTYSALPYGRNTNEYASLYNVSMLFPLSSGFYAHTTAITSIPTAERIKGLIISYETSAGTWYTEQYTGTDVSGWATLANWSKVPGASDFSEMETSLGEKVSKSGNESIEGVKTFSESPIIPTPTTNLQAATKGYVDAANAQVESDLSNLQISYVTDRKYIAVIIDNESRVLFGIKKDGTIDFKSSELTDLAARITSNEEAIVTLVVEVNSMQDIVTSLNTKIEDLNTQISTFSSALSFFNVIEDRMYLAVFTDSENRVLFGIKKDGSISMKIAELESLQTSIDDLNTRVAANEITMTLLAFVAEQIIQTTDRNLLLAITDSENKILQSFGKDGKVSFPKQKLMDIYTNIDRKYIYCLVDSENHILFGIKKDGTVDFKSTHIASLDARITNLEFGNGGIREINCWGDSLTAANVYEIMLALLAGANYSVVNRGAGGDTVATIAARQGGIPMSTPFEFVIPPDADTYVKIADRATSEYLKSIYDATKCGPLYQGDGNSVNPCVVGGIECTMSIFSPTGITPIYTANDAQWRIKRNVAGTARTIESGTIVYTSGYKKRNSHANVFWMGQNGGWSTPEDLSIKYDRMISFSNTENYVIIGLHTGTLASRSELETYFNTKYGSRYFNIREYFVNHGLEDAGLTPTQADLDAIAVGTCPPQLLVDGIHCTTAAYNLIGIQLYNILTQLNVII